MTPEEVVEIRSTAEFALRSGEDCEFLECVFDLLEHIDSHAEQIEALKEALADERAEVLLTSPDEWRFRRDSGIDDCGDGSIQYEIAKAKAKLELAEDEKLREAGVTWDEMV